MQPDEAPDLDTMIAEGEIDASPEAVGAARERLLAREAHAAFALDAYYVIEIAKAASAARERQERMDEDERAASDPATDPERAAVLRRTVERRAKQRAAAMAIRTPGEPERASVGIDPIHCRNERWG